MFFVFIVIKILIFGIVFVVTSGAIMFLMIEDENWF
jgi:hypothetical protein